MFYNINTGAVEDFTKRQASSCSSSLAVPCTLASIHQTGESAGVLVIRSPDPRPPASLPPITAPLLLQGPR